METIEKTGHPSPMPDGEDDDDESVFKPPPTKKDRSSQEMNESDQNGDGTTISSETSQVPASQTAGSMIGKEDKVQTSAQSKLVASDFFNVEISNIPRRVLYQEARRIIQEKFQLKARKLKLVDNPPPGGVPCIYATFEDEEARQHALKVLNGAQWKQNTLVAKPAKTLDPCANFKQKAASAKSQMMSEAEFEEMMLKTVAPLQNMPYEDQLSLKRNEIINFVNSIRKGIVGVNPELRPITVAGKLQHKVFLDVPVPLPSPVVKGYRNKCELTIGWTPKGKRCIGHRASSYRQGSVDVGDVDNLGMIPSLVKSTIRRFYPFIIYSRYTPYDPVSNSGLFRKLIIRVTTSGELMVVLIISDGVLSHKSVSVLVKNLKGYIEKITGPQFQISSFYLKIWELTGQKGRNLPMLIYGSPTITEKILQMKFDISPEAFFQVNSSCAEILFQQIVAIADLGESSTIIDVCCGTGTIGIVCAKLGGVRQVIGIESCDAAVKDARRNVLLNFPEDLRSKFLFYEGTAEELVEAAINTSNPKNVVAIVDPPRAGLASSVVAVLRKCSKIQKIIYVACKIESCRENFVSFARPRSKKYLGIPFVPEKIVPIDMFPDTHNVECVVLLKRLSRDSKAE